MEIKKTEAHGNSEKEGGGIEKRNGCGGKIYLKEEVEGEVEMR